MTGIYAALLSLQPVTSSILCFLRVFLGGSIFVSSFMFMSVLLYTLWASWPIPTFGLVVISTVGIFQQPDPPKPRFRRSRSSRSRYRRFRRRHLHYNLVQRCYSRQSKSVPWSFITRQHRRWRRKKYRQRASYRVKRHQLKWSNFLLHN